MLTFIKKVFLYSFAFIGIFIIHISINYFFSYPFNQISATFLFLLWLVVYRDKDYLLWLALGLSLMMDIFSSRPFGITSSTVLLTLIMTRQLFYIIFTHRSWYGIFFLGFIGTLLYKIILLAMLLGFETLTRTSLGIRLPNFYALVIEALLNAAVIMAVYFLSTVFKFRKKYLPGFIYE